MGHRKSSRDVLVFTQEKEVLQSLDPNELVQIIQAFQKTLNQAIATNKKLAAENEELRNQLGIKGTQILLLSEKLVLIRHELFGASSERRKKDLQSESHDDTIPRSPTQKLQKPSIRYQMLDLVESHFDFQDVPTCSCCSHVMEKMNQVEQSEEVDVIPKKFFVRRILREKYRCTHCHGSIQTAPGPGKIVKGGSYSINFALDIVEQKYVHHLPIERIKKQYQKLGLEGIEGPTLIEQTHHVADKLRRVARAILAEILESPVLHADETTWRMLEGHPKKSWFLWSFGSQAGVYYRPSENRASENAERFLKESRSKFLMVDGYSGYLSAKRNTHSDIILVHCWAHVRRKFLEAEKTDRRASTVIPLINELFKIERYAGDLENRRLARLEKSKPIIVQIKTWVNQQNYLPKLALGQAIEYLIKHWAGLTEFLVHPEIPLDNNFAERSLRGSVLGRKNFYGNHSPRGADTTAILYTVVESCKLHSLNPHAYMQYVITTENENKIPLTPRQYALKVNVG